MKSERNSLKLAKSRLYRGVIYFLVSLALIFGLSGCDSLEDAVEKAKPLIPKGYNLVHIEQVSDNSGIVFYTYNDEISAGIFIKNTFGWDWIGSGIGKLVTYPEGLQWRYADLEDKGKNRYSVYYGKIVNKDVEKVTVTTMDGEVAEGQVVDTEDLRLWYAFVDEPQVPSVNADIVGYSKDDKVLYVFSQPKD
ncbi:MAG: hypothetical protein APF84_04575 [Gracilibacter sp. BRH_c7a]|nr:MAG: hypothetical protein APF84_04575 [Gracilibacter sp. BRH_c7a]